MNRKIETTSTGKELQRYNVAIIKALGQVVYELRPFDNVVNWWGAYKELFGYEKGELTTGAEGWQQFVHPGDLPSVLAEYEESQRKRRSFDLKYRWKKKDNSYLWIHERGIFHFDKKGNMNSMVGILTDISAEKKTQEELQKSLEKLENLVQGTIQAIARTVEIRDPYTAGHQNRVADLARALARTMNLSQNTTECVFLAGNIHDIGKINIPAEILSKPGRLNENEWNIIKSHPEVGYEILKSIDFPWPMATIVQQHHERLNGSGYPKGLKGDNILLEAKILLVADVVEAMASHRPYRPARGLQAALKEIKENQDHLYDSEVVKACLDLFNQGYNWP